jgi:PEP-CTERM motif-containing protein
MHAEAIMKIATLILALCLALATPALADNIPFVDGRYDPGEGYDTLYNLTMDAEGGGTLSGQVWTYQNPTTSDLYLALIVPTDYVDNTYGINSSTGYRGKTGEHTFKDLLNSDEAVFKFYTESGSLALETSIDYLAKFGGASKGKGKKGGGSSTPEEYKAVADDSTGSGFTGGTSQVASSLQYNLDTIGLFLDNSPLDANWIDAVIYEMRIDGSLFANDGLDSILISKLHASPSKIEADNPVLTPGGGTGGAVPEPGSMLLVASGLGGLAAWRRRRRKKD